MRGVHTRVLAIGSLPLIGFLLISLLGIIPDPIPVQAQEKNPVPTLAKANPTLAPIPAAATAMGGVGQVLSAQAPSGDIQFQLPTDTIQVRDLVQIPIQGLTDEYEPTLFIAWPRQSVTAFVAKAWIGDQYFVWFQARQPGDYLLLVGATKGGVFDYAESVLTVGGDPNPNPNPGPDPKPNPNPDPPTPTEPVWGVIYIEEGGARTADQAVVLTSIGVKSFLERNGLKWRLLDKDSKLPDGSPDPGFEDYKKEAEDRGLSLPVVFVVSDRGKILRAKPLPNAPNDVIQLVQEVMP
jgi:hypothetical protein